MHCFRASLHTRMLRLCIISLIGIGILLFTAGYQSHAAYAQADGTTAWDFETGDFGSWTPTGQVAIVTDSIDSLTDNAMHSVAQGQYSLKVGDEIAWAYAGDQLSSIEQILSVPQADGRPVLQFSYAVVANDPPSHDETDKPYFQLDVRDLTTGEDLPASDFKYTSQSSQEWFLGTAPDDRDPSQTFFGQLSGDRWVFIPWKHETVELADRIGHQLLIKFTMRDCNLSAHAAYGYLDNIRIGSEVALPALPVLENNPQPAGDPPAANLIQRGAGFAEQNGLWPWCLLIPLLLFLAAIAALLYKFWPRPVTVAGPSTPEEGSRPTTVRNPGGSDTGAGGVDKKGGK
jgi:hypothetical protein